jgi:hypothetical protein
LVPSCLVNALSWGILFLLIGVDRIGVALAFGFVALLSNLVADLATLGVGARFETFLAASLASGLVPLVGLVAGITWPLSFGGFTSLIPVIVPEELLPPANALEATSFNVAIIAGPALAGTISAIAGPAASLLTEAALTVGAIGLIALIPSLDGGASSARRSVRQIAKAGLRHLALTPPLRSVTVAGAMNLGGIGLLTVAFPFFAVDVLSADRSVAGFMWAAFASGSAIGAITLVGFQTRWPPQQSHTRSAPLGAISSVLRGRSFGVFFQPWPFFFLGLGASP